MKRIVLPWPPKSLWPNARPHWAQKASMTKTYRYIAAMTARDFGWHKLPAMPLRVTFCPKPKGPAPDMDNAIAAFKSGQDGLADVWRINDRDMRITHDMGDRCKDGAVIVEILTSGVVS